MKLFFFSSLFFLAVSQSGCCDGCKTPKYAISLYFDQRADSALYVNNDSAIVTRYKSGTGFLQAEDSFYTRIDLSEFNCDSDNDPEACFGLFSVDDLRELARFDYRISNKKDKWSVNVSGISIKSHNGKGQCACSYDYIDSYSVNDTFSSLKGSYKIR